MAKLPNGQSSAGELEQIVFVNNIFLYSSDADKLVNPPIEPYKPSSNIIQIPEFFGGPVTLDGQVMSQIRFPGTLPPDDGEISRQQGSRRITVETNPRPELPNQLREIGEEGLAEALLDAVTRAKPPATILSSLGIELPPALWTPG